MLKKLSLQICYLFLFFFLISAAPYNNTLILKNARNRLSIVGNLERTQEGFVYVKVSEEYINETLLFLESDVVPPPAYYGIRKVGAHIAAITQQESKHKKLFLPQIGQPVMFYIKKFVSEEINDNRYYYFTVEIPQIELIRLSNGLPSKIPGQDFHITVGIEPLEIESTSQR